MHASKPRASRDEGLGGAPKLFCVRNIFGVEDRHEHTPSVLQSIVERPGLRLGLPVGNRHDSHMRGKLGTEQSPTRRLIVRLGYKKNFKPVAGIVEESDRTNQIRNNSDLTVKRDEHGERRQPAIVAAIERTRF